jgi:hypothetical protein
MSTRQALPLSLHDLTSRSLCESACHVIMLRPITIDFIWISDVAVCDLSERPVTSHCRRQWLIVYAIVDCTLSYNELWPFQKNYNGFNKFRAHAADTVQDHTSSRWNPDRRLSARTQQAHRIQIPQKSQVSVYSFKRISSTLDETPFFRTVHIFKLFLLTFMLAMRKYKLLPN